MSETSGSTSGQYTPEENRLSELYHLANEAPWDYAVFDELLGLACSSDRLNAWFAASSAHTMADRRMHDERETALNDPAFPWALEDGCAVTFELGETEYAYSFAVWLSDLPEPRNTPLLAIGAELYRLNMGKARERLRTGERKPADKAWRALEVARGMGLCGDLDAQDKIVAAASLIAEAHAREVRPYDDTKVLLDTLVDAGLKSPDAVALVTRPQLERYRHYMKSSDSDYRYEAAVGLAKTLLALRFRGSKNLLTTAGEKGYTLALNENEFWRAGRFLDNLEATGIEGIAERRRAQLHQEIDFYISKATEDQAEGWISWDKQPHVLWDKAAQAADALCEYEPGARELAYQLLEESARQLPVSRDEYESLLFRLHGFENRPLDYQRVFRIIVSLYWRAIDELQRVGAGQEAVYWYPIDTSVEAAEECCRFFKEYAKEDMGAFGQLLMEIALPLYERAVYEDGEKYGGDSVQELLEFHRRLSE